jgi:hypothetical protein
VAKDSCYKKIKSTYKRFPSARASQAIAKCRKGKGQVRKSAKGSSLKRWQAEKWKDTKTGKACGAGGKTEYCRPTKRVSKKTPKTASEITPAQKRANIRRKSRGQRAKTLRKRK